MDHYLFSYIVSRQWVLLDESVLDISGEGDLAEADAEELAPDGHPFDVAHSEAGGHLQEDSLVRDPALEGSRDRGVGVGVVDDDTVLEVLLHGVALGSDVEKDAGSETVIVEAVNDNDGI